MVFDWLVPDWPVPPSIKAVVTTRQGGVSSGCYSHLNLAEHCGDNPADVARNRSLLRDVLRLPQEPRWLQQVHGVAVSTPEEANRQADAAVTSQAGDVLAIMTADCLPVLFAAPEHGWISAAHAGWRGLCDGVLEACLTHAPCPSSELLTWLGPAIGPTAFEVGDEVRAAFVMKNKHAASCFLPSPAGRWLADIYGLARLRLQASGIRQIYGGGYCTFSDAERFFSYRREKQTGRMATLIWMER